MGCWGGKIATLGCKVAVTQASECCWLSRSFVILLTSDLPLWGAGSGPSVGRIILWGLLVLQRHWSTSFSSRKSFDTQVHPGDLRDGLTHSGNVQCFRWQSFQGQKSPTSKA